MAVRSSASRVMVAALVAACSGIQVPRQQLPSALTPLTTVTLDSGVTDTARRAQTQKYIDETLLVIRSAEFASNLEVVGRIRTGA
jgi:hypothetical protein